jgi:hypothetical protein
MRRTASRRGWGSASPSYLGSVPGKHAPKARSNSGIESERKSSAVFTWGTVRTDPSEARAAGGNLVFVRLTREGPNTSVTRSAEPLFRLTGNIE